MLYDIKSITLVKTDKKKQMIAILYKLENNIYNKYMYWCGCEIL